MNNIKIIDCNSSDFELVKNIRTAVFSNEQGADADGEFDCYDARKDSIYALLYDDKTAVGTARIAFTDKCVKIGRIAILKAFRGRGYGADIVNFVTKTAFDSGAEAVYVDAQNYAVPFYEKLGFKVIGSEIIDRGLPHIPMSADKGDFYG